MNYSNRFWRQIDEKTQCRELFLNDFRHNFIIYLRTFQLSKRNFRIHCCIKIAQDATGKAVSSGQLTIIIRDFKQNENGDG